MTLLPGQLPERFKHGQMDLSLPHGRLVLELAHQIAQAGGRALVVGGCVRDALLEVPPGDVDLEVYGIAPADLEQIAQKVARARVVGRAFGVLKVGPLDVSVPRKDRVPGRDGFLEGDPWMTLADSAVRRDFTINALAWDPIDGTLYDPCGGLTDLRAGRLHPVDPRTFVEDPVRALRTVRFMARFDLEPTELAKQLCATLAPELPSSPPERVFGELRRILLEGTRVAHALDMAGETGIVRHLWPELQRLRGCPQDPVWHPEGDVWTHTLLAVDVAAKERSGNARDDLVVGLAVLFHDLGKPDTNETTPEGRIHTHGHEKTGATLAETVLRRMTQEKKLIDDICRLIRYHLAPIAFHKQHAKDKAFRRLATHVRLDLLARVARADLLGRKTASALQGKSPPVDWFLERAEALHVETGAPRQIVLGRHLIELGMTPGPAVGELLRELYSRQIDGEFQDLAGGVATARRLIREKVAGAEGDVSRDAQEAPLSNSRAEHSPAQGGVGLRRE